MAAFLAGICSFGYAQTKYEWEKPAKPIETEIGVITLSVDGGSQKYTPNGVQDSSVEYSKEQLFEKLLTKAKSQYAESYPNFALRNFKIVDSNKNSEGGHGSTFYIRTTYTYKLSAAVVIPDPIAEANENLSRAINKAFRNVRQGSRIAIDQVTVWSGLNREDYKDQVIDVLLDKGYKVVAKEYLEKLYEEQQNQQSGIYNDKTTVQENNFSAVGYYINVKVTETSVRVQVINVSTGEYEGNATVDF